MKIENKSLTVSEELIKLLPRVPWLVAGMSERHHGNMRLADNGAPIEPLARARFALELGIAPERIAGPVLQHGGTAVLADSSSLSDAIPADGLVTDEEELFLSVTCADCVPIFLVDAMSRRVGIMHAGWRGLLRGIVQNTVGLMLAEGSAKKDIYAAIGPAIGVCHYEVGLAVARQFRDILGEDVLSKRDGKIFLDLKKSAERLLCRAGVLPEKIKTSRFCAYCDERLFSYRRDAAQNGVQVMMAVIGIV